MMRSPFPFRRRSQLALGQRRRRRDERLHVQPLEERVALAIDLFQYPMAGVSSGSSNYAVLLMDQGTTGFLKKNATPSPTFTYATNSQFIDDPLTTDSLEAVTFGELTPNAGTLSTVYVTSGFRQRYDGEPLPATSLGTTAFFLNAGEIDIGTSDGIVPGTFRASISIVDSDGTAAAARLLASKPGNSWNLSIERISGEGDLPTEGRIDEASGSVVLRGWSDAPQSADLSPFDWGVYTGLPDDPTPLSFTLFPGQTVTQRFLVDLSRNESTISINSPLLATRGAANDPGFFAGAGGVAGQVGQVVLDASSIVTNANISSADLFTIGVPLWVNEAEPRIKVDSVAINRPVASPRHQLVVEGAVDAPGQLLVGEQGALADSLTTPATGPAQSVDVQAIHSDVVFAGMVNAIQQTYLLQSPLDPRAYSLTTVSPTSGIQTGRIVGNTVGITLANDAGGEVNVRTTVDTLRMTASSTLTQPALPYAIALAESDDLTIDAVPASSRPIAISASGTLSLTSSVRTTGDLSLTALNQLKLTGAISSASGNVSLVSDSIASTGPITAGGTRSVSLRSGISSGDVSIDGLVRAGGTVKAPVRVATTAAVDLATGGLLTVNGVSLIAGDRVLVKNQSLASENGIYVVAAGAWSRADDANSSQLLLPGFTVAVHEGTQQGAWTFANAANPTLGQTGLAFVPASAVQAYVPARVATTANVDLAIGGLLTIDGVGLSVDDRVLVKDQANPRQNGLYIASMGAWARASDANTAAELAAGSYVFITAGLQNGERGFVLADDAIQVGNTPLTFSPFTVQATRTNMYSPARVLTNVIAATTVHVDLAVPPLEIDGVVLAAGDLVLVKNQFDSATNGIYVSTPSGLQRWFGADSSSELPRGSLVFVDQGATNANSSWTFNDTIDLLGQTTAGSLQVTNLPSTQYLAVGMLVTGPGIPADTKIDLVIDATSVRLTKSAIATSPTAALAFMQTSAVSVGTDPILFVPTGGSVAITAGRSITSSTTSPSSRITASSSVLNAGRPQNGAASFASLINVNSAVGRMTAIAPASISINDSGAIDLFDVRTLADGRVVVDAQGTITARSISATQALTEALAVGLTSTYGDVVAATITSTAGSVALTSVNERVVVRQLGLNSAGVTAQDGDVIATANIGGIALEGLVKADGTDGDITLQSNQAGLAMVAPAALQATDWLTIITPNSVPSLGAGTSVSTKALSLTSHFGAAQAPSPAFGTYSTLVFNRTDAGNIDFTSPVNVTVAGATTVNGSISIKAPVVTVTGPVTAATNAIGDGDVTLTSTTGGITLGSTISAVNDRVTLDASNGLITRTAGLIDASTVVWYAQKEPNLTYATTPSGIGPHLTTAGNIVIGPVNTPLTIVGASTANGSISISGSGVRITDVVQAGGTGNPVTVTASTGSIDFSGNGRITNTNGPTTLSAVNGGIVDVNTLTQTSVTGASLNVASNNNVTLKTDVNTFTGTVTTGNLTLTETTAVALGAVTANVVTLSVGGNLTQTGPLTATSLAITATAGAVTLSNAGNDVNTLAVSNGTRAITVVDKDGLDVVSPGITGGNVSVTAGGTLTISGPVTAGTGATGDGDLALTSTNGGITLKDSISATNDRVTLEARNGTLTQSSGLIDASTVVWYAQAAPSLNYVTNPTAIGFNITQPGVPLVLGPFGTPTTIAGASTASGPITIIDGSVTITDLVQAGSGNPVTVTATGGSIAFQGNGRIATSGGSTTLSAPSGGITATNTTTQTTVTAGSLTVASINNITLKTDVNTFTGTTAGNLTVTETGAVALGAVAANAVTLSVGGSLTQTGPLMAGSLNVVASAGNVTLTNTANDITTLAISNPGRTVAYTDLDDLVLAGVNAVDVSLDVGAPLSQSAAIVSNALTIVARNGGVRLTDAGNDVGSLSVTNPGRVVFFTDATGLEVAGLTAAKIALNVGGDLTQTGSITGASTMTIAATAGSVTLANGANDVTSLAVSNPGRNITYTDINDVSVAGISGGAIDLDVGGPLKQSGAIVGTSLGVTTRNRGIQLTNPSNDVDLLTVSNPGRYITYTDADDLVIGGLVMGTGEVTVGGDLTQNGAIAGSSLGISSLAGTINLLDPGNNLSDLSLSAGGRAVSYADADSVAITSAGGLAVGTISALGAITIVTTNGGGLDVGPGANAVLQAVGVLDLRAIQGQIGIRNGGRIIGNPLLLPAGQSIQIGGSITDSAALVTAVNTVNSLPAITGATYDIVVGSSMTLTQTLTVDRPVTFRGTSTSVVLYGSPSVTSGLVLNGGAGGSIVRSIAFSNFSSDAIRASSLSGITITGVRAANSGTGIRLSSVSNSTIGGTATGAGNVLQNCTTGIFASGICTNTRLVKNTFAGTRTQYNISGSRGITVVR